MFAKLQPLEIKQTLPDVYNGIQLLLVVQGSLTVRVLQKNYHLQRNDLLLINRYEMHHVTSSSDNAVLQLLIPFEYLQQEGEALLAYTLHLVPGTLEGAAMQACDEIRQLLYYMLTVQHYQLEGHQLELRANLFRLMHLLLQHFKLHAAQSHQPTDCADPNIRAVVATIHEQFRQPLSLDQMAKRQFLSTHYLSRLFKEQMGIGFLEYLTRVRLESARKDLLYTNDSIIQIALHNGFPSAQAFAAHFKRLSASTPTEFRNSLKPAPTKSTANCCRVIPFQQLSGLAEIAKHLGNYEQESSLSIGNRKISVTAATAELTFCNKVLKVGSMGQLLHGEVRRQLMQAQARIKFEYIHFLGVFHDDIKQDSPSSMFWGCDYTQIFPLLQQLGLCPIIRIDLDFLYKTNITPEQACETLRLFFSMVSINHPESFTSRWLYELYSTRALPPTERLRYCQCLHRLFKSRSPKIKVGFSLDCDKSGLQPACHSFLSACIQSATPPDFITFSADPNPEYRKLEGARATEQLARSFFLDFTKTLRNSLQECGLTDLPMFLLEWNTLVGANLLERASFYRAALIVETLLQLSGTNVAPSFWLSEHISEAFIGIDSGVLSLYHCMDFKRAIFHTLHLFARLGTRLLSHNDGILVTQDSENRLIVLGYHPCYFSPIHAIDFNFVKQRQRSIGIVLSGMPDGDYRIKAFRLAMNFTYAVNDQESIFHLPNINVPYYYSDPDAQEHLSAIAAPQYSLLHEHIKRHCRLHFDLSFNALKLYVIDQL